MLSRLAEDIDSPIVEEDVAIHDADEDTVRDRPLRRLAKNRPPDTKIIKGLRSARMSRREAVKDLGNCVVNVTVINCINMLLTYAKRRKHNGKARIWYLSTWFQVEVVGKGSLPDKLYSYFLVEN
ncbi:hypothetical protein M9H77_27187 [Catharanthus roseus]|uniref:Uncharacterized protein n=1 Tax=Catharanthus roseus TaxID=4058 RepID=A0ACC0ADY3_CATRO|nr:hypothetical protein M9H77_27187 [Catharanthus roseus]